MVCGVKPAGIMKTLSGTFVIIVASGVVLVAVLSFHTFAAGSKQTAVSAKQFNLTIGKSATEYVGVDKQKFLDALSKFKGKYQINYSSDGRGVEHYPPLAKASIKTDKITTSEVAKNAAAEGSAANDPNVTRFLNSDTATDLKTVLDAFP
jgi:hypothetical protein